MFEYYRTREQGTPQNRNQPLWNIRL